MKKKFFFLLICFSFSITNLRADLDFNDIGSENIKAPEKEEQAGPFTLQFSADFVGEAKVSKCCNLHRVQFATGEAEIGFVFHYNSCYHEGAIASLNYDRTYLNWKSNHYFSQTNFDTIGLSLGGFSERVQDWLWRGQVTINFDNIQNWTVQDYMNFDLVLWGRYTYCHNVGLHIGFLAMTGMGIDRVYPVIGFDWEYDCNWKLNVIYPVNISVVYTINPSWNIAIAGRVLDQRHRLDKDAFLSKGLWHYSTRGAEFAVNYSPAGWLVANVHIGYNLGGTLQISDRHYHHRHRIRLESAPYAGADFTFNF